MLPMADLRALFESLGHTEVTTFIQSGNVVFTSRRAVTPATLENAIGSRFGIGTAVVLRTPGELKSALRVNPFARRDPSRVHVGFMTQKPSATAVASLDAERFLPEEFVISGRELYLHLPNGMGRAKLPAHLDRQLKVPTTIRTLSTVTKLLALAEV